MSNQLFLPDEPATLALGATLAALIRPGDVVTLSGPLGSGKTTLARGLLGALGLEGEAASPSYPIVIAYAPPETAIPIWHVDLYRIDDRDDLAELGLDDALSDTALLVEWPDRAGDAWPEALALTLEPLATGGRRLTWTAGTAWGGRWPPPDLR